MDEWIEDRVYSWKDGMDELDLWFGWEWGAREELSPKPTTGVRTDSHCTDDLEKGCPEPCL
jgi:hypothetical protein